MQSIEKDENIDGSPEEALHKLSGTGSANNRIAITTAVNSFTHRRKEISDTSDQTTLISM